MNRIPLHELKRLFDRHALDLVHVDGCVDRSPSWPRICSRTASDALAIFVLAACRQE